MRSPLLCAATGTGSALATHAGSQLLAEISPTQEGSTATLATLLTASCLLTAGALLAWASLSYGALALAERGSTGAPVRLARRYAIPPVRRSLAAAVLATTLVPSPALAAGNAEAGIAGGDSQPSVVLDLGWGADPAGQADPAAEPTREARADATRQATRTANPTRKAHPDVAPETPRTQARDPSPPRNAAGTQAQLPNTGGERHAETVIVRPGDTMWSIARRHLPPGAPDADIARAVQAWIAANPSTADNPDLIRPGQELAIAKECLP